MPEITYPEFKKMELVVAQITAVEAHPNADKLYVLKVDIGEGEERQLVAGLKPYYAAEALQGKRIIIVKNLAQAVLRGEEPCGPPA